AFPRAGTCPDATARFDRQTPPPIPVRASPESWYTDSPPPVFAVATAVQPALLYPGAESAHLAAIAEVVVPTLVPARCVVSRRRIFHASSDPADALRLLVSEHCTR